MVSDLGRCRKVSFLVENGVVNHCTITYLKEGKNQYTEGRVYIVLHCCSYFKKVMPRGTTTRQAASVPVLPAVPHQSSWLFVHKMITSTKL